MAPIIEFFVQLVAIERFLVELMTVRKKVHKLACVQRDMIEREDSLFAVFGQPQTWRFSSFFDFVAVGSFAVDGSLLQPTGGSTKNSRTGQKVYKEFAVWCIDNKRIRHTKRQAQQHVE